MKCTQLLSLKFVPTDVHLILFFLFSLKLQEYHEFILIKTILFNRDCVKPTTSCKFINDEWLKVFKNPSTVYKGFKNGLLISGPPGIGKSSAVRILSEVLGYEVLSTNASD